MSSQIVYDLRVIYKQFTTYRLDEWEKVLNGTTSGRPRELYDKGDVPKVLSKVYKSLTDDT